VLCCWGAGAGVVDGVLVAGATGAAGVVGWVVVVPSGVWTSGGSPFFARRSFRCASRSASRSSVIAFAETTKSCQISAG
jgi:hypothetical protein